MDAGREEEALTDGPLDRARVLKLLDKLEDGFETPNGNHVVELLDKIDWHEQQLATIRAEIRMRLRGNESTPRRAASYEYPPGYLRGRFEGKPT